MSKQSSSGKSTSEITVVRNARPPDDGSQATSQPRTRRWAPRTRMGCATCRTRRIKCDEGKPSCLQCIKAKRQCVGYLTNTVLITQPRHSTPVDPTMTELSLNHYFNHKFMKSIHDGFNAELWGYSLPQATASLAPIWHASNAVAGLAWSRNPRASLAPNVIALLNKESTMQFSASIQHVLTLTRNPNLSVHDKTTILLANVLFCLHALQTEDTKGALDIVTQSCRLIRQWKFWESIDQEQWSSTCSTQVFYYFVKMEGTFLESQPENNRAASILWQHALEWLVHRPITSLIRAYLEVELVWTTLQETLHNLPLRPSKKDVGAASRKLSSMRSYTAAVTKKTMPIVESAATGNVIHGTILNVRFVLIDAILKIDLARFKSGWDETLWDEHEPAFRTVVDMLKTALEEAGDPRGWDPTQVQFAPALARALNFVARVCREPVLRRRAANLLRVALVGVARINVDLGSPEVNEETYSYLLVDDLIKLEEQAWHDADTPGNCTKGAPCILDKFICNEHRVAKVQARPKGPGWNEFTFITVGDVRFGSPGHKLLKQARPFHC
ncbi:putative transcriptional regulatory protein [Beauveria bassiana]|nr:putative transcriptional regulatory protein [Beauveria bassiana]KAH8719939.1 putative transcriptional regulatory protein C15D4.02 [Beauveria bassiana]